MTYIYDVLLNFTDERLLEFFEWTKTDIIENIKKIPIFKINSKTLNELLTYQIKIDKEFLLKIKNKTTSYKTTKDLEYTTLFTDHNRVVGIEFNNEGLIICRSSLLLDEEEDVIIESIKEKEIKLNYEKLKKLKLNNFYTREQNKKINYILKELEQIYKEKKEDKLNYIFKEIYPNTNISFENQYLKLKKEIEKNYSSKYDSIYEILKLTYTKK